MASESMEEMSECFDAVDIPVKDGDARKMTEVKNDNGKQHKEATSEGENKYTGRQMPVACHPANFLREDEEWQRHPWEFPFNVHGFWKNTQNARKPAITALFFW